MFKFKLPKLVRNRKGFQLMDIVASLGLSSLTAIYMQSYMLMQSNEMQKTVRVASRESLVQMIKLNTNLINIKKVATSLFNKDLEGCLLTGKLCKSLEEKPLVLFANLSNVNNQFESISGTETNPKLYDATGLGCPAGSKDKRCIYEVITSFRVQCKANLGSTFQPAPTCTSTGNPIGIELVEVFYKVRPVETAKAEMKGTWQEYEGSIIVPFN